MNSALHSPPVVIFLTVIAISFLIASLDFLRRRARARALTAAKPSELKRFFAKENAGNNVEQPIEPLVEQPVAQAKRAAVEAPAAVEKPVKPLVETKTLTPIERLTKLHTVDRTVAPTLAIASILPLPMPAPRVPTGPKRINVQISWWQEA